MLQGHSLTFQRGSWERLASPKWPEAWAPAQISQDTGHLRRPQFPSIWGKVCFLSGNQELCAAAFSCPGNVQLSPAGGPGSLGGWGVGRCVCWNAVGWGLVPAVRALLGPQFPSLQGLSEPGHFMIPKACRVPSRSTSCRWADKISL